jgi:hypothetical protein
MWPNHQKSLCRWLSGRVLLCCTATAVFCASVSVGLSQDFPPRSQPSAVSSGVARVSADGLLLADNSSSAPDLTANAALQQSQSVAQPSNSGPKTTADGLMLPQDNASPEDKASDGDLGEQWVMKHNERLTPLSFFSDVSLFHTTNVALVHDGGVGDSFFVADIGVNYSRPIKGPWAFTIGLSESFFRYDKYSEFDFDSFSAGAGVNVQVPKLWNINFGLQYGYSHLSHEITTGELFSGHSISLGATKAVKFSSADFLSFGIAGGFSLTEPSSLQHGDVALFATYNLSLSRWCSVAATARETFFGYANGRDDFGHSLTLNVHCLVNRWFSVNASGSGTWNQSSEPAFDYKVFNLGMTISGNIQF